MLNAAHAFVHGKFLRRPGMYDELLRLELMRKSKDIV